MTIKAVRTLVAAHRLLRTRVPDARLLIAGTPDPANPASVTEAEAKSWNDEAGIAWLGHVDDIAAFLGEGACRGIAVAPRGPAAVVDGSGGVRPRHDRKRRAGMPRSGDFTNRPDSCFPLTMRRRWQMRWRDCR